MAPIVSTIDIDRRQGEVFAYVTDPSTFAEWQTGVVGGGIEGGARPAVGSKCMTTRRIGGAERESTSEVTKLEPPTSWAVHGIDGPIRATVNVTVEPLDGGAQSRVTIAVDFVGHGIGKLLVPLVVRRQARNEMPANCHRLKQRIEARASPAPSEQGRRPLTAPPGERGPNVTRWTYVVAGRKPSRGQQRPGYAHGDEAGPPRPTAPPIRLRSRFAEVTASTHMQSRSRGLRRQSRFRFRTHGPLDHDRPPGSFVALGIVRLWPARRRKRSSATCTLSGLCMAPVDSVQIRGESRKEVFRRRKTGQAAWRP
jgi:hypothetical protein